MSTAYVIELPHPRRPRYIRASDARGQSWGWCHDVDQALQFARRCDAATFAARCVPTAHWRVVGVAPYPPVARRVDWPLVSTIEQLAEAIFDARDPVVGVRIPVCAPGKGPYTGRIAFAPPVLLRCYLGDVCHGSSRRWVLGDPRLSLGPTARALFRRAYFPHDMLPAIEWHVEYSIDFAHVPVSLIPDSFLEDLYSDHPLEQCIAR